MTVKFDDQTVLVTGAGRGLGRSYAHLFAARGAHVVVHDAGVDPDGGSGDKTVAKSVVAEIGDGGGEATASYHDLSTPQGCQSLIDDVLAERGRIDALVSNAGIVGWGDLENTDEDLWGRVRRSTSTPDCGWGRR